MRIASISSGSSIAQGDLKEVLEKALEIGEVGEGSADVLILGTVSASDRGIVGLSGVSRESGSTLAFQYSQTSPRIALNGYVELSSGSEGRIDEVEAALKAAEGKALKDLVDGASKAPLSEKKLNARMFWTEERRLKFRVRVGQSGDSEKEIPKEELRAHTDEFAREEYPGSAITIGQLHSIFAGIVATKVAVPKDEKKQVYVVVSPEVSSRLLGKAKKEPPEAPANPADDYDSETKEMLRLHELARQYLRKGTAFPGRMAELESEETDVLRFIREANEKLQQIQQRKRALELEEAEHQDELEKDPNLKMVVDLIRSLKKGG